MDDERPTEVIDQPSPRVVTIRMLLIAVLASSLLSIGVAVAISGAVVKEGPLGPQGERGPPGPAGGTEVDPEDVWQVIEGEPDRVTRVVEDNLDPAPSDIADQVDSVASDLDSLRSDLEDTQSDLSQLCNDLSFSDAVSSDVGSCP